jgi:hypothetical protein
VKKVVLKNKTLRATIVRQDADVNFYWHFHNFINGNFIEPWISKQFTKNIIPGY